MRYYSITFRSVTFAQKGESVLHSAGIDCTIRRTPRWMEAQGCGYCLRLRPKDSGSAVALLKKNQIPFRKVYMELDNGNVEEVEL